MRRATVLGVLAGTLQVGFAAPASAAPPDPGAPCAVIASTDTGPEIPEDENERVVVAGSATAGGSPVRLTCSVHVGSANRRHSGARTAAVSDGPRIFALVAAEIGFAVPQEEPAFLCTEVEVGGDRTYYQDAAGTWSTSPDTVCRAYRPGALPPEPAHPVVDEIERQRQPVDRAACELLLALRDADVPGLVEVRADGDVHLAGEWYWDCPPYGVSGS